MLAGYFGGPVDTVIMRVVYVILVIPQLPLMLVIIAVAGRGIVNIILVIGLLSWSYMARIVRAQVLTIKERTFILRVRSVGVGHLKIMVKHILPQVVPMIFAEATLDVSFAIISESTLSFLGLGDPTLISWGMMLNQAFLRGAVTLGAWWYLIPPGIALAWVTLGFTFLGNALQEIVNPRLKTHHLFDERIIVRPLELLGKRMSRLVQPSETEVEQDDIPLKTLLSVRDLTVEYQTDAGNFRAVENLTFNLEKGKSLGLVGESGCGKTTAMLAVLRLLPEVGRIIDGSVKFRDTDILRVPVSDIQNFRWNNMSMIFQGAMSALNPTRTVGSQIEEAMQIHDWGSKLNIQEEVGRLLDLVGISPDRASQYPHEYSGGMRQRAMIAMALACRPDIVIADEPTTALDVMIQAQILDLLQDLQRELNLSIIMVTHDLGMVAELCDEVVVMYGGWLIEHASVDVIFNNPRHPYTQRLLGAFPDIENPGDELASIPGAPPSLDNLPKGCRYHPRCHKAVDRCSIETPSLYEISSGHVLRCLRVESGEI
jgi:peptide/nickel transport system permease protein